MAQSPNLLFILSDNHNRDLLGCYGESFIQTPNIDRIAATGTRFSNAYSASPLCCPARAALATGQYPHQTGYWDNAIVYDGRVPSWMHRIRDAGIETVAVGKLHFRSADDDNGFSEEIIPMHIVEGRGAVRNLLRGYDAELDGKQAGRWQMYLHDSGEGETHYQEYDRDITARAAQWLRKRGRSNNGWALFVSYVSPHPPFKVPKRFLDLYPEDRISLPSHISINRKSLHPAAEYQREKFGAPDATELSQLKRMIAGYYGLITHMDEQVGILLDCLSACGLGDNTRIIYSSDHGEMRGAHGLLGKGLLYEDALAVPLIISDPSLPGGKHVDQIVSHVDLYPTVLDSFSVPISEADKDVKGVSLWPALRGQKIERMGFAEYHANFSRSGSFMLREGPMKLHYHVGMPPQLFNLANDPHELNDLSSTPDGGHTVARMENLLRQICDPEAIDERAKADQRRLGEKFGGKDQLAKAPNISFSPPPGLDGKAIGAFGAAS
ncbi:MAG: sulfatase-like hydrolase/transferase [Burkholderiales bacterium]|nr:sulfatase-like hydrolase/transferase [Burkholderiales bacterium]